MYVLQNLSKVGYHVTNSVRIKMFNLLESACVSYHFSFHIILCKQKVKHFMVRPHVDCWKYVLFSFKF
jgi:hypothetical protein